MSASATRRRLSAALFSSVLLLALVVMPAVANAEQAGLDPSYGGGGWSLTAPGTLEGPVPGSFEIGSIAASLDPAGRLLVAAAGTEPGENENSYLVARFLL